MQGSRLAVRALARRNYGDALPISLAGMHRQYPPNAPWPNVAAGIECRAHADERVQTCVLGWVDLEHDPDGENYSPDEVDGKDGNKRKLLRV